MGQLGGCHPWAQVSKAQPRPWGPLRPWTRSRGVPNCLCPPPLCFPSPTLLRLVLPSGRPCPGEQEAGWPVVCQTGPGLQAGVSPERLRLSGCWAPPRGANTARLWQRIVGWGPREERAWTGAWASVCGEGLSSGWGCWPCSGASSTSCCSQLAWEGAQAEQGEGTEGAETEVWVSRTAWGRGRALQPGAQGVGLGPPLPPTSSQGNAGPGLCWGTRPLTLFPMG